MQPVAEEAAAQGDAALGLGVETVPELAAEWEALAERTAASIFLRPGWFEVWWDAFGGGEQEILSARRDGELVGVLPLIRARTGLLSMTNWHSPRFGPVAADRDAEQILVKGALESALARGRLDLSLIDREDSALMPLVAGAQQGDFRTIVRTTERSPYVELDGDWESFEAGLTSKRRSDLRRRRRRLEEQGDCRFECAKDTKGLAEGLAVEEAGWAGRDGTPIKARADTQAFYQRLAEWAAERDCLRLFFLRLDGNAVAFAYCIVDRDSLCVLKLGFHPSQARLAPGLLLTREMIRHAFEEGFRTYEFLGQVESYKMIWTDEVRDRVRVQAFPATAAGLAGYMAWKRLRPVAKWAIRTASEAGS